jgi:hemin uptake protein HemP
VNAPQLQITDQLFKTNLTFALFVFLLCRLTSGDRSSTPPLRRNLKKRSDRFKCAKSKSDSRIVLSQPVFHRQNSILIKKKNGCYILDLEKALPPHGHLRQPLRSFERNPNENRENMFKGMTCREKNRVYCSS